MATPVDWKQGGDCMVLPTIKEADVPALFPNGISKVAVPSGKEYIRITSQPN